ncbi:Abi family protein [Phaeospirillum tilakii]|uniref:Abi family protein n=1 Tax=Phaeospirillum tilakii TaxID=741673 RepID=A0ABW5CEJ4_9PROT
MAIAAQPDPNPGALPKDLDRCLVNAYVFLVTGCHTSFRGVQNGNPFFYPEIMPPIPYAKPYASPADLVTHLIDRNLDISDRADAEQKIAEIGYDRLRIYFASRRQHTVIGKPFRSGTTFDDIMRLYALDEELRALCFRHCSKFELAFRNLIAEELSSRYGPHPYFDDTIYDSEKSRFSAVKCLSEIFHKSRDPRAKHYFKKYNPPHLPPIWTLKEFMTFGSTNVFFKTLSNQNRLLVSNGFGVTNRNVFEKWIDALIDFRNVCAHHDRLWNRTFQKEINAYHRKAIPSGPPTKLKAFLEVLEFLLGARGHRVAIVAEVTTLLRAYPVAQPSELGF